MTRQSKFLPIRISERDVLYEDENYIAINKQSGWLVHASVDKKRPTIYQALTAFLRYRDNSDEVYLRLHHRLDLWTSGVLLLAKSEQANPVLADIFKNRSVDKVYHAICKDSPVPQRGELKHFLAKRKSHGRDKMVSVERGGKKAVTRYRVLQRNHGLTFVEFELLTGRTHQLRAQSALAGFPILGDDLYGDAGLNEEYAVHQQLLHAHKLSFYDTLKNKHIAVEAPTPPAFSQLLHKTETHGASPRPSLKYYAFYKPFGVLCQFTTTAPGRRTLSEFQIPDGVYAAGRLDADSEGLLLLTNDGESNHLLTHPKFNKKKVYWVQVEGTPSELALDRLRNGVTIRGYQTQPASAKAIQPPTIPPRTPPIRVRKHIPTSWLEIELREGKNRQIRRMTAAVGHPTLRLIRVKIANTHLGGLQPGELREISKPST